jgi:ribosomal protein L7/L12
VAGILGWFNKVLGGGGEPAPRRDTPAKTEAGRFSVVLDDVGPDRRAVVDALLVITPLEIEQLEAGLKQLPFTVRLGLTHSAARSVRDRLVALGARAQIEEFGD